MNREIKFRAWDKKTKTLREVVRMDFDNDDFNLMLRFPTLSAPKNWKLRKFIDVDLMQSTGLHDKNGVEIYEGDIVYERMKGFAERKSIVQQDLVNPCFVLERIDNKYKHTDYEYDFDKCGLMTVEVIGNIFENPELLER